MICRIGLIAKVYANTKRTCPPTLAGEIPTLLQTDLAFGDGGQEGSLPIPFMVGALAAIE